MPKLTFKRLILFVALILLGFVLAVLINKISDTHDRWVDFLISVGFPSLLAILSFVIKPFSDWLDNYLDDAGLRDKCTIYLYGIAGVGKTSLCESFNATATGSSQTSTDGIKYYTFEKNMGNKNTNVAVLDYQGQKQSEVTVYLPEKYAGSKNKRIINSAIFMVDIVGRRDNTNGILDTTSRQLSWLGIDTENKVKKRIDDHVTYINGSLEIVFASIFSINLRSIRLVINKFDLIQELLKTGKLSNNNNLSDTEFAKSLFTEITTEIQKACNESGIQDFSIEVISAKNDYNTRTILENILRVYNYFVQAL